MDVSYNSGATGSGSLGPTIAILPPLPSAPRSTGGIDPIASSSQSSPSISSHANNDDIAAPAPSPGRMPDPQFSSPRLSSTWESDLHSTCCHSCQSRFDKMFKRRHHCRLCGLLFCEKCSSTRSLIPPSALVLKAADRTNGNGVTGGGPSFRAPSDDGDASVTYVGGGTPDGVVGGVSGGGDDTLLYGRGLEQRILLARHPQRTCHPCREQLAPLQEELCLRNSNAMRYNYIDEGDAVRRLCNSPLAFTLGHEVRKAAYTLGNLLPEHGGGRVGPFAPGPGDGNGSYPPPEASCRKIDPTLRGLDKMHIPADLLRRARGVAIVTSAKGGLGFAGFEFGTGLVVARRSGSGDEDDWSAPSAIGIASLAWGALVGAQVSDHVFLLMTEDAVRLFSTEKGGSIQLGVDVGVALGPLGRSAEADIGANGSAMAPVYTYSLSKGLYAGVSLDGRVLVTRGRVNEKFYGRSVSARELL